MLDVVEWKADAECEGLEIVPDGGSIRTGNFRAEPGPLIVFMIILLWAKGLPAGWTDILPKSQG